MNVKELKEYLKDVPDDFEILMTYSEYTDGFPETVHDEIYDVVVDYDNKNIHIK
jgi:hypothetical protein